MFMPVKSSWKTSFFSGCWLYLPGANCLATASPYIDYSNSRPEAPHHKAHRLLVAAGIIKLSHAAGVGLWCSCVHEEPGVNQHVAVAVQAKHGYPQVGTDVVALRRQEQAVIWEKTLASAVQRVPELVWASALVVQRAAAVGESPHLSAKLPSGLI
jgi:hypothetical protein